ncbi:MAG TPA: substrate-binding domain-containing protein [Cytophagaceae bacterium]|jgi:phosphate transport system substrate-binding protein
MIGKLNSKFQGAFIILFWIAISSCSDDKKAKTDTATSGYLQIAADESFKPLLQAEEETFESLYSQSKIDIQYIPEGQALEQFLKDSVEMLVCGKMLDSNFIGHFRKKGYSLKQSKIASDGIAIIVNNSFKDSVITLKTIGEILQGKIRTFNEVSPNSSKDSIYVAVDKGNSSNLNLLYKKFRIQQSPAKIFAAGSNDLVIQQVISNSNYIGVIGTAMINDEESPQMQELLKKVKVLGIQLDNREIYYPFQGDLEKYPFKRDIYAIIKGARNGLGTGFASFIYSDRGQRIILKSGLLPVIIPGREIEIK